MGNTYKMWEITDKGVDATPKTVILQELEQEEKKLPNQLDNLIRHGSYSKYLDSCPASECDGKECQCVYESDCHGIEMIKSPSGKENAVGGTKTKDRWKFCPWCGGSIPNGDGKECECTPHRYKPKYDPTYDPFCQKDKPKEPNEQEKKALLGEDAILDGLLAKEPNESLEDKFFEEHDKQTRYYERCKVLAQIAKEHYQLHPWEIFGIQEGCFTPFEKMCNMKGMVSIDKVLEVVEETIIKWFREYNEIPLTRISTCNCIKGSIRKAIEKLGEKYD